MSIDQGDARTEMAPPADWKTTHLELRRPAMTHPSTDDLVLVIRHVAGSEARCARQATQVAQLRADEHATTEDEVVLGILRQSVVLMRAHQILLQAACEVP